MFGDDTPVNVLAPGAGRTKTAQLWTCVRDERPWAGAAPRAAFHRFSADRQGIHPAAHLEGHAGFLHADGYVGFETLLRAGAITEVACMAHVRRKFVDICKAQGSAIADEAVRRMAGLHAVEARARGQPPDERARIRRERARPLFEDLERWLHARLPRMSGKTPLAAAIGHALTRMGRLGPWLEHGFVKSDNNAAERAIRPLALGRKNWLFAGAGRQVGRHRPYADRDRPAQRCRSPLLAEPCSGCDRRPPHQGDRRAATVESADGADGS